MVVSASKVDSDAFIERVIEAKNAILSLDKVRALLAGRVKPDEMEARAQELLDTAVAKRLGADESVVLGADSPGRRRARALCAARRARARPAPPHPPLRSRATRSPRRTSRRSTRCARRSMPATSAPRASTRRCASAAGPAAEVKRIVFRPEPRDDE